MSRFMLASAVVLGLSAKYAEAQPIIFSATGANAAAIQPTVDAYRAALGANNGVGGSFPTGRREINWDAIPTNFLDPHPANFFNSNSPRGIEFSTPGSRFKVSGDSGTASFLMADVTAQQWGLTELDFFSPQRMFAPIDSNITDALFFVPGTSTPATVRGFGAIFVDVDAANATAIELLTGGGQSLFQQFVAPSGAQSKGFSFLGVILPAGQQAARVRITSGNMPINAPFQSPPPDGVAIDDLIYGEPVAVPEPTCLALVGVGAGCLVIRRRWSRAGN